MLDTTTHPSTRVFECAMFGQLRTAEQNSKIFFCLKDVMAALGLSHVSELRKRLQEKGCNSIAVLTKGGRQQMTYIDEANLYRCIFQSRKAEAEKFQDWVFEEVLPAIRKDGGYIAQVAEDTPETLMARALKVADATLSNYEQRIRQQQERIEAQTQQLQLQAPKVQYAKKNLVENLRGSENGCIFAAVTDGSCTYFAEQAVKLLTSKVGFFIAHLKDIGGCLLRKIIKALGVEIPSVTSAKWQPLFPMPTTV